jgi:hypothetical protein
MRCIDDLKKLKQALLAAGVGMLLATAAQANIIITEVSPWSSGSSPLEADWFELTNTGVASVDITGWKVDDGPGTFAASLALTGITSVAAGESVIFLEQANDDDAPTPAEYIASFQSIWFGGSAPAGLQIGTYQGSGIGLSSGGDQVNVFNGAGTLIHGVAFGNSDAVAPLQTFDNAAGLSKPTSITQLSVVGVNGAFTAVGADEIGSPGRIAVPEPASAMLLVVAVGMISGLAKGRRSR